MANKRNTHIGVFLPLLSSLAGCKSDGWHPLVKDFILVGRKLEKLGFIYSKDEVIIVDPDEVAHVGR